MPAGRPTKITEASLAKLEQAFAAGCSDIEACLFAGMSVDVLYDYQRKNPEYTKRKQSLKENLKLRAKLNLKTSIEENQDTADSKWYLERKCKDEFSTKVESDNTNLNMNSEEIPAKDIQKYIDKKIAENEEKY